ncbi:MAG: thermonuclease family protein [Candidatus Woesearchaeota archaeon]|nr:MAG: thermonuclease family protein [Candidatus Woesearchaeota archaeon]
MKKLLLLFFIVTISGCSTGYVVYDEPILEGPFKVVKVIDGDTLDLNDSVRVRLSGINTPEKGECYYKEAKERLKELTLNKTVFVERDIDNKDRFGRELRYVILGGVDINAQLVEEGYARVFDKYKDNTKKYDGFKVLESRPKEIGLGVWGC